MDEEPEKDNGVETDEDENVGEVKENKYEKLPSDKLSRKDARKRAKKGNEKSVPVRRKLQKMEE